MFNWEKTMSAEEARKAMELERPQEREPETVIVVGEIVPIQEELVRADRMYGEAVGYAREFMDAVKRGRPFDFNGAIPLVSGFIESVFRNESAAAAIGKLKTFDKYTYTHCINVSILAVILGKRLGYSLEDLELIGLAGIFHDVGKALVPERILNKPGKLSEKEMNIMRTHPLRGYELLKKQPGIPDVVLYGALDHHEKFDGSGYPRGLKGDAISDFSRLLSVVDVYDALTSKRVYKDPLPPGRVLSMMFQWRVTDFHPNIVEEFIKSLGVYPVGSFVRLSNGHYAVVIDHNQVNPLKPLVREVYDGSMRQIPAKEVDLVVSGTTITEVVNPDDYNLNVYRLI